MCKSFPPERRYGTLVILIAPLLPWIAGSDEVLALGVSSGNRGLKETSLNTRTPGEWRDGLAKSNLHASDLSNHPTPLFSPFQICFVTSNLHGTGASGNFTVEVHPDWAPFGAQRIVELVKSRFFDGARFFRVIPDFIAQFGIAGDPSVSTDWRDKRMMDDIVRKENIRGRLTFATSGKDTRTTQMFVNFKNNTFLDSKGFAPFAEVIEGMDIVESLYGGYGEGEPDGKGPSQSRIETEGNPYLVENFPLLSFIETAIFIGDPPSILPPDTGGQRSRRRKSRRYSKFQANQHAEKWSLKGTLAFLVALLSLFAFGISGICRCDYWRRLPHECPQAYKISHGGPRPAGFEPYQHRYRSVASTVGRSE